MTSGSLGQGLSFGLGCVLASRLSGLPLRVFALLGDGECEEGQIWEAAMAAAHWKADNLTAIIDHNKYQQTGPIAREMSLAPFAEKWRAFGWEIGEVDGHGGAIITATESLKQVRGRPQPSSHRQATCRSSKPTTRSTAARCHLSRILAREIRCN
jgi:transketolase